MLFTETKSMADFCAEIGSVNQDGKPVYVLRTNNDKNHKNYGKRHIVFRDATNAKAAIASKLLAEEVADPTKLQVSWFEDAASDREGYMVHGIGVAASYDEVEIVIG